MTSTNPQPVGPTITSNAAPSADISDAPPSSSTVPHLHTYHCICNQLILASTHVLSTLPRRQAPGLDEALILPLPPLPRRRGGSSDSGSSSSSSDSEPSDDDEDGSRTPEETTSTTQKDKHVRKKKHSEVNQQRNQGYSLLLSTTLDRRPNIIRREDGFEKRWLWRCGRCRVVVGYQLDVVHFVTADGKLLGGGHGGDEGSGFSTATSTTGDHGDEGLGGAGGGGVRQKPEGKVIYLLPLGLVSTEEMMKGRVGTEEDVVLKGGSG